MAPSYRCEHIVQAVVQQQRRRGSICSRATRLGPLQDH